MGYGRLVVVGALFLASLVALVASAGIALWSETNELAVRDRILLAAAQLANASRSLSSELPAHEPGKLLPEEENRRLATLVNRVLADYPEAEGGFYLSRSDQFAGVVGPISQQKTSFDDGKKAMSLAEKADRKKPHKKDPGEAETPTTRRDPPPMETDPIRQLARSSLVLEPGAPPLTEVRDIGPSRVAIAATAIDDGRPATMAVWVMIRLTGPEQQKARLGRLQLATILSLVGILFALGLAVGLTRSLRQETRKQEHLRDELRKSEHLAALGRMLAGVAHEIRNPLTAIRSTIQLWERLPDHARTPESLAAVVTSVDHLNELVGRLLLFARAGHEDRRAVDLNAVVAETLELIRARAEAQGVKMETNLAQNLPIVVGASQVLGQVALNLVANALQAMPEGGKLSCHTRTIGEDWVELVVADTGPGIAVEARERIFEPFFTTRPDGTGLGLALCREVARQHGGDVTFDSKAGPGATFHLALPVARGGMR